MLCRRHSDSRVAKCSPIALSPPSSRASTRLALDKASRKKPSNAPSSCIRAKGLTASVVAKPSGSSAFARSRVSMSVSEVVRNIIMSSRSVCQSVSLSVGQFVSRSVCQSVSSSVGQFVSRSVLSVGQFVSRSVCQSVSSSVGQFASLSGHLWAAYAKTLRHYQGRSVAGHYSRRANIGVEALLPARSRLPTRRSGILTRGSSRLRRLPGKSSRLIQPVANAATLTAHSGASVGEFHPLPFGLARQIFKPF